MLRKSIYLKTLFLMLCAFALLILSHPTESSAKDNNTVVSHNQPQEYKIIGYVAGWRQGWTSADIDAGKLTHINYAFADIVDGRVTELNENDTYNFQVLDSLRIENPALKLLISVGGWTRSTYFSDAALTQESRYIFAKSAVDFMLRHNLDGVDLDWEYPGHPGAGNVYRKVDKQNFTLMLKELRRQLDEQSAADNRTDNPYLLTIATGASKGFLENTEMHLAHQYLDFINVMTYDYHTGGSPVAGHHANLYPNQSVHFTGPSADQSIQWHIDAGIPSEKLVLGVAFYGRYWTGVRTENNGIYQFAPGSDRGTYRFDELRDNYINKHGFKRYWDEEAKAPFLWNAAEQKLISYDDEESIRHKSHYIKARGLGGAMFWEYSNNFGLELLDALYHELILNP